jgi:hypothetical protein
MKSRSHNPRLKAVYLEAVENQLRDNNPPETRQTFDRLRREGYNEQDAKVLIASVIAAESFWIMKSGSLFNQKRFVRNLKRLPNQSFDET